MKNIGVHITQQMKKVSDRSNIQMNKILVDTSSTTKILVPSIIKRHIKIKKYAAVSEDLL